MLFRRIQRLAQRSSATVTSVTVVAVVACCSVEAQQPAGPTPDRPTPVRLAPSEPNRIAVEPNRIAVKPIRIAAPEAAGVPQTAQAAATIPPSRPATFPVAVPLSDPQVERVDMAEILELAEPAGTTDAVETSLATEPADPIDRSVAWWHQAALQPMLDRPQWVSFDLQTVLLDTLRESPRIQIVSTRTSMAMERIVQQDAAFDPALLLETRAGRTNDPVGSTLATGGPPRLIEESYTTRGGVQRSGRRGTVVDLSQELGLLSSNSTFFNPQDQGNARLSLSLTQPLLDRGGQVYNERLLTQARIDSRVTWQEMRGEVEQRIADVVAAYWLLYELRCHVLQADELLQRARRIEAVLEARRDFDAGDIELAKARGRVARRADRKLQLQADVKRQQAQLARLVGSEELNSAAGELELIPLQAPWFPNIEFNLRDAVLQGIENRPEVHAAAAAMESAALSIQVTRTELEPQLTAVVDAYLSGLNGNNQALTSFGDQFTTGGPGLSAGLRYDLPYARRAARSRHREANLRYHQRSEELREAIQLTRADIETALINVNTAMASQVTKRRLLATAIEEETILTRRWEMMAGDGAAVGTVLENLLDAQQRRTDAEREWVSAQSLYLTSLVQLQRAMGTLLIRQGIEPIQHHGDHTIEFLQTETAETAVDVNAGMHDPAASAASKPAPTQQELKR